MATKSKPLVIGGTGYIGKYIVAASARLGHPTFAVIWSSTVVAKAELVQEFHKSGVTILDGDLCDQESLVSAIKQVDVVISTIGSLQLKYQTRIIDAIKEAGGNKRFFPSEFGNHVDRTNAVNPAKLTYAMKVQIRRLLRKQEFLTPMFLANFAGYFLPKLAQAGASALPIDKVVILGDGNTKGVFVNEDDIGTYTIKAVDDPRNFNKILYIRPPANILSHNDLVTLWEKKVGKTLERVYVPEEEVLKQIQESPFPLNLVLAISHAVFVMGDQTSFEIEPSFGVEATELYPDVKYTTVDEYLNRFL